MDKVIGLAALEAQINQDLQYLNLPISSWSLSDEDLDKQQINVAIIGAGMSGPEIDAQLIADSITQQLEKRIMFRRAMKRV